MSMLPTCANPRCRRPMLKPEQRISLLLSEADNVICWVCKTQEEAWMGERNKQDAARDAELERAEKWEAIAERLGV